MKASEFAYAVEELVRLQDGEDYAVLALAEIGEEYVEDVSAELMEWVLGRMVALCEEDQDGDV